VRRDSPPRPAVERNIGGQVIGFKPADGKTYRVVVHVGQTTAARTREFRSVSFLIHPYARLHELGEEDPYPDFNLSGGRRPQPKVGTSKQPGGSQTSVRPSTSPSSTAVAEFGDSHLSRITASASSKVLRRRMRQASKMTKVAGSRPARPIPNYLRKGLPRNRRASPWQLCRNGAGIRRGTPPVSKAILVSQEPTRNSARPRSGPRRRGQARCEGAPRRRARSGRADIQAHPARRPGRQARDSALRQ
jgi:hypothetical protein